MGVFDGGMTVILLLELDLDLVSGSLLEALGQGQLCKHGRRVLT